MLVQNVQVHRLLAGAKSSNLCLGWYDVRYRRQTDGSCHKATKHNNVRLISIQELISGLDSRTLRPVNLLGLLVVT